ncbi:uncharacterized protein LOC128298124 [Anopheles moucheti]|uniref:uncharacterized protein LOC128298124 n=1 Tax=Anopheles moucheti TaxID=186751 RepID=UPI0022F00085|nr:uncharacterized protein LOC128298124 [Anopheles moucheti]
MAELNRVKWKCITIVSVMMICACEAKSISDDTVELDVGYKLEPSVYDAVVDDEVPGVLELHSSLQAFTSRKQRDKRQTKHQILESAGLRSHFRPSDRVPNRAKRHTEAELTSTEKQPAREDVAVAEKQTMNAPPHKSSEFQAKVVREESDSDGEESMFVQEGIKSRAPRVNFVTQQTKGGSSVSSTESRDTANSKLIRELYRKPLTSINYERSLPRTYDSYMATSQSPMYPRVYNKYDSFHHDMMNRMHPPAPHRYDHYYERRHDVENDSYFPRYKYPYYYYYPDRRYDVPLYYRDRNYLYTNEIEQPAHGFPMYNVPFPATMIRPAAPAMRNRRIIYFATLPEIVRTHPKEPYNQRLYQGNRYEPYNTRAPQTAPSTYKDSRPPKSDDKGDKYVSSKPIKIVRETSGAANKTYLHRDLPDDKNEQQQQRSWSNIKEPNRSTVGQRHPFLGMRGLFLQK